MNRSAWAVGLVVAAMLAAAVDSGAFSSGKHDVTSTGCFCHCASPNAEVVPAIGGLPSTWTAGTAYPITVSFTGGPGFAPGPRQNVGGFNLLVRANLDPTFVAGALASVDATTQVQGTDAGDATHRTAGNDQSSWPLQWTSPPGPLGDGNVVFRLTTNSVNGDGGNGSGGCTDRWNAIAVTLPGPVDAQAPVLSGISATPGATFAAIAWTTDEPADSRVDYGTDSSYGSVKSDARLVTSHAVQVTGLEPATLYHFQVTSEDLAGHSTASGDFTFTTLDDAQPPVTLLTRPARGQIYVNDGPRPNPLGGDRDPIATPLALRVQVFAADALSGVEKVEFFVDGALRATVTQPVPLQPNTYQWTWQLTTEGPGAHQLTSVAYDQRGNTNTVSVPVVVV